MKLIPFKNSYAEKALKNNKPVALDDISEAPNIPERIRLEARRVGHRAWATIPIQSGAKSIGVMNLAHFTPERKFSLADTHLLHLICKQIAQTIENHRFVTAMLESESKYQEIFHNVTDMIMITDLSTRVHTANSSFLNWLGFSEKELYSRRWPDLMKDKKDIEQKIKIIQRKGTIKNWPVTFIDKDDNEILSEMDVTLIKQENKPVELLSVIRDITERVERQRNIIRSQKMASLSLLVSGIAHEFNNLLGTIHTWATFSRKNIANQTMVSNTLNIIDKQVKRGRNIVQDLLLFSGNYQPAFRTVKISLLMEKILAAKEEECQTRGISIQAFYHYRGLLECDPYQLEILFNNVLNNSFDALVGRKIKKVIIRIIGQDDKVRITIFDNGRGMTEKTANRIFEPFFSTKNKRGVGKGIGVGLAICYGIVENHGGQITVESELRVGTTFFITLNKKMRRRNTDLF